MNKFGNEFGEDARLTSAWSGFASTQTAHASVGPI